MDIYISSFSSSPQLRGELGGLEISSFLYTASGVARLFGARGKNIVGRLAFTIKRGQKTKNEGPSSEQSTVEPL